KENSLWPAAVDRSAEAIDLIAMVQNHDVPYALWRKSLSSTVPPNDSRWQSLLDAISDWRLFVAFLIVDNCTVGKSRQPLLWFLPLAAEQRPEIECWKNCALLNQR
ncbi:MAG: hypothetical protein MPJ50_19380, partial [Pirellulales bacterium]|nr:hypothetical protein [Pirellulales bacterium]